MSRILTESEPLPTGLRVDREAGIVYSVRVLGRSSPNSHGVKGVSGTVYTTEAMREALPLYEGIRVMAGHNRTDPRAERPP